MFIGVKLAFINFDDKTSMGVKLAFINSYDKIYRAISILFICNLNGIFTKLLMYYTTRALPRTRNALRLNQEKRKT